MHNNKELSKIPSNFCTCTYFINFPARLPYEDNLIRYVQTPLYSILEK